MFIQTETTPNPETLKFLPGRVVLEEGTEDFPDFESARKSRLAMKIISIRGVVRVFFGNDFISVSKEENIYWEHLKPAILGTIMEHFQLNLPIIDTPSDNKKNVENFDEKDAPIVKQIIELLETRVRPAVTQDGGDIQFHGFDRGIVYLTMQGACAGCPSSTITLKMGIQNLLRHYIPEVIEVRPVL
ncbi:MAG: NifU family protein [Rhodobacteraceae bacterium]|nr:NifU family protein [Paracoccaceae bacterium]